MVSPSADQDRSYNQMYDGPMEEAELVGILREMERDASAFYSSELALVQTEALERYNGRPYGDEMEGRSQAIENDLQHVVDWITPHILRPFLSSDHILQVESELPGDEPMEKQIQGYLEHIFWEDNAGDEFLHDFVFDALVTKVGIASVKWQEPEREPPKLVRGILPMQLQKYLDDEEYEIIGQESYIDEIEGQPVEVFDIEYIRTPKYGKVLIEVVPPEEFSISRRAANIETAEYHRRKQRLYASELMQMYPDKADEIDPKNYGLRDTGDEIEDLDRDPRRQERFENEAYDVYSENRRHERMYRLDVFTEYLRIDYDGDGIVEYRRFVRVGNTILENEIVDRSEFVSWSPVRVSHKWAGQGINDQCGQISQIRTQLTRKMLDSLSQSLAPRRIVNGSAFGPMGADQLSDHDIGDVIEIEGNPNEAVMELVTPDVSPQAYQALEYFAQRLEVATGMTRHAQGIQPEAITDTAKGIQDLTSAANQRIELMARWLARALEHVFRLVFECVAYNQTHGRLIKIQGEPILIDPRTWNDECSIKIDVGDSVDNREQKLEKLGFIAMQQKEILLNAGMGNPWVTPQNFSHTLHQMVREAGYNQTSAFFAEIPPDYQPPEQKSEAEAKAEADMQKAQLDAQTKQQQNQADLALEAQKSKAQLDLETAKADHNAELEQIKLQNELEMQAAKLAGEQRLAEMKIQSERELAEMKMGFEQEMARQKFDFEKQVAASQENRADQDAERKSKREDKVAKAKSFRPGGALYK